MEPSSIAVIALAVCLFAAFSRKAERSPLTPPMFFVAVGFCLGGEGLGWMHLDIDGDEIHVLVELTLVLVLFTDAARIDLTCLRREESLPARLLGIGLPLTIVGGAAVALAVLPEQGPPWRWPGPASGRNHVRLRKWTSRWTKKRLWC